LFNRFVVYYNKIEILIEYKRIKIIPVKMKNLFCLKMDSLRGVSQRSKK
jgi:hypothetical protein